MKYALTNAKILDGMLDESGKMPIKEGTVLVHDGMFSDICFDAPDLSGYEVIDLKGKYLLPGLINAHVHLASMGNPNNEKEGGKPKNYKKIVETVAKFNFVVNAYKKIVEKNAQTQLMSGVTTIRAVGGVFNLDGKVRDEINDGKTVGPRILAANTAISVPGGHFAGSLATESTDPVCVVKDIEKIAESNPNLIKLMITGGVMDATENGVPVKMMPELILAACEKAHKLGYQVAAHVESTPGIRIALENGVDTIEHGAPIDDELVELFKKKKAAHICTFSPCIPCSCFDESTGVNNGMSKKLSTMVADGMKACALACLKNGIPLGLGTDAGCPWTMHYNTWRELCYFVKFLGISNDFALHTATKVNADILGIGGLTGTIEKGKSADFVIMDKNPLEDLRYLSNISAVSIRGKMINNPKVKKFKKADIILDKVISDIYN